MKFFESTKFILIVGILNIIIVGVLLFSLVRLKWQDSHSVSEPISMSDSGVQEDAKMDDKTDYTEADDSLTSMCMTLLENSYADLGNGMAYYFEDEGTFRGFFDADHPRVEGYRYAVNIEDHDIVLTICDQEERQTVSYVLVFVDDGGLALDYPGFDEAIPLQY